MTLTPNRPVVPFVAALLRDAEESESLGHWRIAREQHEQALRELLPDGDPRLVARLVRRVARCLIEEADMEGALDALQLARTVAAICDDQAGIAHAINLEGIVAQQRGNIADAEELYRWARTIAWQDREVSLVAMLDQNLGTIANIRGDYAEAKLRYEASLAAYRTLGMRRPVGPLLNNLGMLHTDLGEWRDAERYYAAALREASACGDLAGQLRTEANRADMYVNRRRFRKAKRLSRRVLALGLCGEKCEGSWVAEAYKHLGVAYRETGAPERAEECFTRSLRLAEQREDTLLIAETLRELGVLHDSAGRYQETVTELTRAHELFSHLSARRDLSDVNQRLRDVEARAVS
ncbi:MAG TPA: tetratricopeptide repeat protein [Gemmatimonadaceae bacterium]